MFVQSGPYIFVQTGPCIFVQNSPYIFVQSDPYIFVQSDPYIFVQNSPYIFVQSDPYVFVQGGPYFYVQNGPYIFVQSDPYVFVLSGPYIFVQSGPHVYVQSGTAVDIFFVYGLVALFPSRASLVCRPPRAFAGVLAAWYVSLVRVQGGRYHAFLLFAVDQEDQGDWTDRHACLVLSTCVAPPTKKTSFRRFFAQIYDWKHLYLCIFLVRHSVALPQLQLHF